MAELDLIKNSSFEAKLDELVAVLMREKGMVSSVNGMIDAVVLDIPENTSDLNNDSGFITKAVTDLASYYLKSETYNKEEIDALIAPKLNIEIVTALPTDNISSTTIYLVPTKARTQNIYEEYIYVNGSWEFIGTTEVDLSNYYTKTEIDSKIATDSELGIVKVDGDTITVDADGTLHGAMKIDVDNALSNTSENPVQNKVVKAAIDNCAKTADLANYVHYTGTNGVLLKTATFSGGGRSVYFNAVDDGRFALVDNTNGGLLMEFSKDGKTNAFNGTAIKATADANGNNIASTYATKASLGTAAAANTTTSVTSGGTGLPTAGAVYTAIQNAAGGGSVSASNVTAGTFGGQVVANSTAVAALGTSQIRNIQAGTSALTAGTSSLAAGQIYVQYTT